MPVRFWFWKQILAGEKVPVTQCSDIVDKM